MSTGNMDIKGLPLDVRNHLRSSSSINTVSHGVMELVSLLHSIQVVLYST